MNYLIKTGVFSLVGNYLHPSNNYRQSIFNINAVVLILIICKKGYFNLCPRMDFLQTLHINNLLYMNYENVFIESDN